MKVEFSLQIFLRHSKIKFHENPTTRSRVVPGVRTDRHDKSGRRFLLFAIALETEQCAQFGTSEIADFWESAVGPPWHIWQSCICLVSIAVPPVLAYILFLSKCYLTI